MKHANFYLSVLSLAVIGLSGYTAYGLLNPPSEPAVLGDETSVAPVTSSDVAPANCKVGLKQITAGSTCTPKPARPVRGGPTPTPVTGNFYSSATYECQDGSTGQIEGSGWFTFSAKPGSFCQSETQLKKIAESRCLSRSSCKVRDYVPCAELMSSRAAFNCNNKIDFKSKFSSFGLGVGCNLINNMVAQFCPGFKAEAGLIDLTNLPVVCRRDPKTALPGIKTGCPTGQFKTLTYTCQNGTKGTIGSATDACKTIKDLKSLAGEACGNKGTCKTGICGDDNICTTPATPTKE